jgi:hypothetical protein
MSHSGQGSTSATRKSKYAARRTSGVVERNKRARLARHMKRHPNWKVEDQTVNPQEQRNKERSGMEDEVKGFMKSLDYEMLKPSNKYGNTIFKLGNGNCGNDRMWHCVPSGIAGRFYRAQQRAAIEAKIQTLTDVKCMVIAKESADDIDKWCDTGIEWLKQQLKELENNK